jgi:hypothetical protein
VHDPDQCEFGDDVYCQNKWYDPLDTHDVICGKPHPDSKESFCTVNRCNIKQQYYHHFVSEKAGNKLVNGDYVSGGDRVLFMCDCRSWNNCATSFETCAANRVYVTCDPHTGYGAVDGALQVCKEIEFDTWDGEKSSGGKGENGRVVQCGAPPEEW